MENRTVFLKTVGFNYIFCYCNCRPVINKKEMDNGVEFMD